MNSDHLLGLAVIIVLGAAALYYPGILLAKRASAKIDGRYRKMGVFLLVALTCWVSEFLILKAIADYQKRTARRRKNGCSIKRHSRYGDTTSNIYLCGKGNGKSYRHQAINRFRQFNRIVYRVCSVLLLRFGHPWAGNGRAGRPFRRRGKCLRAPAQERQDWSSGLQPGTENLPAETRNAVSQAWLEIAAAEHASVATFSKLSLQLLVLGAPPHLLSACHQAALDEIEHARCCYSLASVYGARALGPSPFTALNGVALEKAGFEQLALESLHDGCLMEGYFSAYLDAASREALDPALKASLLCMSEDEARHAQLAWDILSWCLSSQPSSVAPAIRKALAHFPTNLQIETYEAVAVATSNRHGFLPKQTQEQLYGNLLAMTQSRALQLLKI